MPGFILDIIIEYLVRILIRFIRAFRARAWLTERAKITSIGYRPGGFGCAVADLAYKYSFEGEPHEGTNANPFIWTSSAKDYSDQYCSGDEIIVRVNPKKPEASVMLEKDQWPLPEPKKS
jgi:Protein of unknown function (DUF3592)